MKYLFLLYLLVPTFAAAQKIHSPSKIDSVSAMECTELSEEPKPLNKIRVIYPAKAKKADIQGRVTYSVLIDTNGNVEKTVIDKSDNIIFNQSVINAVKKLRFTPGIDGKTKARVWWTETLHFKLDSPIAVPVNREPEPLQKIKIRYPQEGKKAGIQGKVTFSARIDTNGNVKEVSIDKSDNIIFNQAVINKVLKPRFSPAMRNEIPVQVWYRKTVTFKLNSDEALPDPN